MSGTGTHFCPYCGSFTVHNPTTSMNIVHHSLSGLCFLYLNDINILSGCILFAIKSLGRRINNYKIMNTKIQFILIAILTGAVAGGITACLVLKFHSDTDTKEELIADFYATETAVLVSPHGLRGKMDKGINNFVLVDVRSEEEYAEEHIIGAVNIPAYSDRYTSAYGDVERIVDSFQELRDGTEVDIIVYCYSVPCMTGRKVGNMLAENGIYVKELGIGWNEWKYDWTGWNHPHEWETTIPEEYTATGTEPGTPILRKDREVCPIDNELGC